MCFVWQGGDSDAEDSSSEAEKEVEASFELFDPQDEDAACVLLLLRHSRMYSQLGLQPQDLRALAEVIAGQVREAAVGGPLGWRHMGWTLKTFSSCGRPRDSGFPAIISRLCMLLGLCCGAAA